MPLLTRSSFWYKKPGAPVPINRSHPLFNGASSVFVWPLLEGGGLTTSEAFSGGRAPAVLTNSPVWTGARSGRGIATLVANLSYVDCGVLTQMRSATQFTWLAVGQKTAGSGGIWTIGCDDTMSSPVDIEIWTDNNMYIHVAPPISYGKVLGSYSGEFVLGMNYDGTQTIGWANNFAVWWNGVKQTVATGAGLPISPLASTLTNFWIGRNRGQATYSTGRYDLVVVIIGKVCTAAEHSSFAANPWSIFQPLSKSLRFALSAGGGSYTFSASGLPVSATIGADTAALIAPLDGILITGSPGGSGGNVAYAASGLSSTGLAGTTGDVVSCDAVGQLISGSFGATSEAVVFGANGLVVSGLQGVAIGIIPGVFYYYDLFAGNAGTPLTSHTADSGATWPNDGDHVAGAGTTQLDGNGMIFNLSGTAANIPSALLPITQNFEVLFNIERLTAVTGTATGIVVLCTTPFGSFADHYEYLWIEGYGFTWHHNGTSVGSAAGGSFPTGTIWFIKLDVTTSGGNTTFTAYNSTTGINGPWSFLNDYTIATPSNPIAIGPLFLGTDCTQTTGTHIGSLYVQDFGAFAFFSSGLVVSGSIGGESVNLTALLSGMIGSGLQGSTGETISVGATGQLISVAAGGTKEGPSPGIPGLLIAVVSGGTQVAVGGGSITLSAAGIQITGVLGSTGEVISYGASGLVSSGSLGGTSENVGFNAIGLIVAASCGVILTSGTRITVYPDPFGATIQVKTQDPYKATSKLRGTK